MKNKITRVLCVLMAALMMGGFSIPAYAGGGPEQEETTSEHTQETETQEETKPQRDPQPLTPEGNLSLLDDIEEPVSGESDELISKQFITVVSKNGNTFYLIIDRAKDGDNTVHFLNQVDESDLLALIEDDSKPQETTPPTTTPEPVTPEPEPEPTPEKKNNMGGLLATLLVVTFAGGGAFYYFRILKPKQAVKGSSDLEDYDFEDEEDEEYETELVDLEQEGE